MKYFYICFLTWYFSDAIPLNNGYYSNKFRTNINHKKSNEISRAFHGGQHYVFNFSGNRGQSDNLQDHQINTLVHKTSHSRVLNNNFQFSISATSNSGNSVLTQRQRKDYAAPSSNKNYQKVYIQTHSNVPSPTQEHNINYSKFKGGTNNFITKNGHPISNHGVKIRLCSRRKHYNVNKIETSNLPTTTPKTDSHQIFRDLNNEPDLNTHSLLLGIWSFPDSPFDDSDELREITSLSEIPVTFSETDYNEENDEHEKSVLSPTQDSPETVEPSALPNYNSSMGESVGDNNYGIFNTLLDNSKPKVDEDEMVGPTPQPKDKDEIFIKLTTPQPVDKKYNGYGVVDHTVQFAGNKAEVDDNRLEVIEPTPQTNDNNIVAESVVDDQDTPLLDNSRPEPNPSSNDTNPEDTGDVHEISGPTLKPNDNNYENESKKNIGIKAVSTTSQRIDNKNAPEADNEYVVVEPTPQPADSKPEIDGDGYKIVDTIPQSNDNNFTESDTDENVIFSTTPQPVDIKNQAESTNDIGFVVVEPTPQPADNKPEVDDDGYEIVEPTPQTNEKNLVAGSVDYDGYEIVEPTPQPNGNNSVDESEDDDEQRELGETRPKDADNVQETVETILHTDDSNHADDGHGIFEPIPQPDENNSVAGSLDDKENSQPADTKAEFDYRQEIVKPTPQPNDSKFEESDNGIVKPIYHRNDKKSEDENKIITSTLQPDDINNFEDADAASGNVNENSIASATANPKVLVLGKAPTEDATGVIDIDGDYDIPEPIEY